MNTASFVCMADIESTTRSHPKVTHLRDTNELSFVGDRDGFRHIRYEIDLDRCATPAAVLGWIYQVKHKAWMTPDLMFDILTAFDVAMGRGGVQGWMAARAKG